MKVAFGKLELTPSGKRTVILSVWSDDKDKGIGEWCHLNPSKAIRLAERLKKCATKNKR